MWKLLAGITVAGALAFAQGPPRGPRPWWDGNIAKNANLSDAQQKQVEQIQRDYRPRMIETRKAVNKANAAVAAAFNEDPVDQTKANAAIEQLASANAEATRAVSQLELKLRTILTTQQWQAMNGGHSWPDRPGPGRRRGPPTSTATSTQPQK